MSGETPTQPIDPHDLAHDVAEEMGKCMTFKLTRPQMALISVALIPWCAFLTVTAVKGQFYMESKERFDIQDAHAMEDKIERQMDSRIERIEIKIDTMATRMEDKIDTLGDKVDEMHQEMYSFHTKPSP